MNVEGVTGSLSTLPRYHLVKKSHAMLARLASLMSYCANSNRSDRCSTIWNQASESCERLCELARTGATSEAQTSTPTADARIQSVARAKALLDAMAGGDWVSLRDLAIRTGLAKTTAFNLVSALVDVGLTERDAKAGAYRLSLQHLVYGKAVERRLDIAAIARPHLIRLCAAGAPAAQLPQDHLLGRRPACGHGPHHHRS